MLEKVGKEWLRTEYRINKKGAECFRTEDREEAILKLKTLSEEIGRRVKNTKKAVAPAGVFFGTLGAAGILSTTRLSPFSSSSWV